MNEEIRKDNFGKKELYWDEFSKTMKHGDNQYLSFFTGNNTAEEFDILFNRITENYGKKHLPLYRMCDAEYMYCVGRRVPAHLPLPNKIKYHLKTILVNLGIITQKTGHENKINKETWFGETYSIREKKLLKDKYLNDLRRVANEGYLSPHLVYSASKFAHEYIEPILKYFKSNNIILNQDNYFPFYFVYAMLSLDRYKKVLFNNKKVLVITAFNERNKRENFSHNLQAEGASDVFFYEISYDKSMLDIIDKSKLPETVDLVLIGAGIGSVNIINQIDSLNALCIDAGHALDCFSRPQLRVERLYLLPDVHIK